MGERKKKEIKGQRWRRGKKRRRRETACVSISEEQGPLATHSSQGAPLPLPQPLFLLLFLPLAQRLEVPSYIMRKRGEERGV